MREALAQAHKAAELDEVPIGAVAVVGNDIIARAHNLREATKNPLGHAEILLLQQLMAQDRDWRMGDVTVYVTCEPCPMCAGALVQARIGALYYGCRDPKAGACGSLFNIVDDARLNHRIPTTGGLLGTECGEVLTTFFRTKRQ
jgi:tRNA(adenine34) deaminase